MRHVLYDALKHLGGSSSPSPPVYPLLSSLGSLPVSLLQAYAFPLSLVVFRVHLPAPLP